MCRFVTTTVSQDDHVTGSQLSPGCADVSDTCMARFLSQGNSGIDLIVSYNANEDDGYAERERSRSEAKQKRKRSCKRTGVLVCRVVVMAVIVASYILLGGLVIMKIESPPELERIRQAKEANKTIREGIINLLAPLTDLDYNRSSELAEQLIANISAAAALGAFQTNILESWDYAQSVFFVGTTITTIGFGNVTVSTSQARAFIVFYAVIGVPLAIILIANLGKLLSRAFKTVLKPFRKNLCLLVTMYILLLVCGMVLVVFLPAIVFHEVEGPESLPDYGTALYFCFVTLSTIGYGRFVVLKNEHRPESDPLLALYVAFFTVWMFVGLAYLGLIIQEVVIGVSLLWKKFATYLPCCGEAAEMDFEERPLEKLAKKARKLQRTVKSSLNKPTHGKRRKAHVISREFSDSDLAEPWLNVNVELCEDPSSQESTEPLTSS